MRKTMHLITGSLLLLTAVSCWFDLDSSITITAAAASYHFVMRLLIGGICNVFFPKEVNFENWWFREKPGERTFYKAIQIKKWKSMVPTYREKEFDFFRLSLNSLCRNMCKAEICHEVIILFSFLPLCFSWTLGGFWAFLITSFLAALADVLPVLLQRYNRFRMLRLMKMKNEKKVAVSYPKV